MAFTFGFYNALNHDRKYDAKEMSKIFDGLLTDGVYPTIGNKFIVRTSNEANTVIVGSGRSWFDHSWNLNDADMPISGPASHILYPRIDAVVLDINSSDEYRTNSVIWLTGTAASTPTRPSMIHTETHNQYPLAYIYRAANNNTISAADITNCIGTNECPYAAGLLVDRKNIAQVEDNDFATKNYALGEYIIWYDQLYKVTTAILEGASIVAYPTAGYNVKSTMIATELYEKLVFDIVPTANSNHAVTSDGIYKALGNHSAIQTTSSVTSGSQSLITSGGIYTALGNRTQINTSAPTNGSNNLITSGQVYTALGNRASLPTAFSAPAANGTNMITNGQVYTALGNRTAITTSAPTSGSNSLITSGQVYTALGNRTSLPTAFSAPTLNGTDMITNGQVYKALGNRNELNKMYNMTYTSRTYSVHWQQYSMVSDHIQETYTYSQGRLRCIIIAGWDSNYNRAVSPFRMYADLYSGSTIKYYFVLDMARPSDEADRELTTTIDVYFVEVWEE